MRKNLAAGLLLLLAALCIPVYGQELVILHTNDLHGQSLARLATVLEEQRQLFEQLIWVDAGDLFSGTAISTLLQGQAEEAAVLELGLAAITFGNHDFDFGLAALERSLAAGVPWVCLNVFRADGTTLAPPFFIREAGSIRVLITGLATPDTPRMSFPDNVAGLVFTDPVPALQKLLDEQAGNYDVCVVLSHLGYGEDQLLAQRVPGIDVIIGGHSHTVLNKPVAVGGTLICQAGSNAQYLGRVVLSLQDGLSARGELLRIAEDTPPHPRLVELDRKYEELLAAELDQVIGYSRFGYVKNGLGVLLVKALKEFSGADAALYNSGGVRDGLPSGQVTRRDVYAVEPFGNQVVVITLSGAQMAQLLEAKAKRSGDFYEGPRLVDTSKTYTVATSDYLAVSEAGYWVLARGEAEYLGVSVREVLEKYLAEEVLEIMEQGAR